jgi:single-stranded-DNA-specific exonuclease
MSETGTTFRAVWDRFDPEEPLGILSHNDADGLSSAALLSRGAARLGRKTEIRILGRGENPWSAEMRAELASATRGGLIVADLGVRGGSLGGGAPTVVIDHHVPTGVPTDAVVISGAGLDPIPTTSLLAFQCMAALAPVDDLLWLAAVGLIGDLGDKAPFAELVSAKAQYGVTALRELVSLVNAPRRSASGDASAALALLLEASSPKEALSGRFTPLQDLRAARDEVKAALESGRRAPPRVKGDVALITLDTPCQIHPLVAQSWRTRLRDKIVIAANHGYRPGWVHFAARSATGRDLIAFLRDVAPPAADENYGSGHREATGGALRLEDWPVFLANIGFEPAGALASSAATSAARDRSAPG